MKSRESSETGCYRDAIHLFMQRSLKLKQLVLRANVQQFYQICLRNVEIMLNQSPFNAFSARISIVSSTGTLVKSEETSHVRMRQDASALQSSTWMFCRCFVFRSRSKRRRILCQFLSLNVFRRNYLLKELKIKFLKSVSSPDEKSVQWTI